MSSLLPLVLTSGGSVTVVFSAVGALIARKFKKFIRDEATALVTTAVDVAVTDLKAQVNTRFDLADQTKKSIADKQDALALELARQFGGNGGGMRQAINELSTGLARLEGQFDQHIQEGTDKSGA